MKRIIMMLTLLPLATIMAAQTINYNDVAVIINDNSQTSINVGTYFKQKRNIPNQNMIHISCTTNEEIDSLTFENIRQQIENYLTTNNLVNSINYIVTTKGVPLKISQCSDCFNISLNCFSKCKSFDSELSLILGSLSNNISKPGGVPNPYLNSNNHFSKNGFGIYLVTRLDGYTQADITNLIDRSGPNTAINKSSSKFIFDVSYISHQAEVNTYFQYMKPVYDSVIQKGWNAVIDTLSPLLLNQQNVFGYCSISRDTTNQVLNNKWVNGSIAEVMMGGSCITFNTSSNTTKQFIVADLVKEGVTGTHGYTSLYYFGGQGLRPWILFNKYIDTAAKYNLAESYYMSIPMVSSVDVVVGDPKTSIIIDNTAGVNPVINKNNISIFPNPNDGNFVLELNSIFEDMKIDVYNNLGQVVYDEKLTNNGSETIAHNVNLPELSGGIYAITISSGDTYVSKKFAVKK